MKSQKDWERVTKNSKIVKEFNEKLDSVFKKFGKKLDLEDHNEIVIGKNIPCKNELLQQMIYNLNHPENKDSYNNEFEINSECYILNWYDNDNGTFDLTCTQTKFSEDLSWNYNYIFKTFEGVINFIEDFGIDYYKK